MHTVALAPRRELEKTAGDTRDALVALMDAIDKRNLSCTVKAAETAYLAVGTLLALSRAAESR